MGVDAFHLEMHDREQADGDRQRGDERLALGARIAGDQALHASAESGRGCKQSHENGLGW